MKLINGPRNENASFPFAFDHTQWTILESISESVNCLFVGAEVGVNNK